MTPPEVIMWTVVVGIGFPAAFRNWTALALCLSWLLGELTCRATGNNLPLLIYFILDYAVLLVIFLKAEICDLSPYRTIAEQLKAVLRERSWQDAFVAAIFPVMWIVYVVDIGNFYRWWVLWGLVQLQFFAAGSEAWGLWRAGREKKALDHNPPGMLKLGWVDYGL